MPSQNEFSIADYCIFAGTLGVSVAIGIFYAIKGGGQKTTKQFFMGNRQMPLIPTALSLLVSFQSGILILGFSSEVYMKGITFAFYVVGFSIGIPLACITYIPIFYNLQITSVFEYLELRYKTKIVRYIGSVLQMLGNLMYMSIVLYAPSTAMAAVSNLSLELLLVITAVSCTFYTMVGGLKAVVWADAFQAIIMYAGLIAVIVLGVKEVGSFKEAWTRVSDGGRLFFETSASPFVYMNIWVTMFGTIIGWMTVYGTSQACMQRYCSLSTLRRAQWSMLLVVPGLITMAPLVVLCGGVMFAYYHNCDPLILGSISNRDQLLPYFTLDVMSSVKGMPGMFLACLYSGTLSTVSTVTNSISAVIWEDYVKPIYGHKFSEIRATQFNKALVFFIGMLAMGLAFLAQHLGGVFQVTFLNFLQASLTVLSTIGAPTAGLFMLGVFFPWATMEGAIAGVSSAIGIIGWICIGAQLLKPYRQSLPRTISGCTNETLAGLYFNRTELLIAEQIAVTNPPVTGFNYIYKLSYKAYGISSILLVLLVGGAVSLLTRKTYNIDDDEWRLMWQAYRWLFGKWYGDKTKSTLYETRRQDGREMEDLLSKKKLSMNC